MALSKQLEELYKKTMEEIEKQLEDIDAHMEEEIQNFKDKVAKVQESKKALKQVYAGIAEILGIEVEIEEEGEEKVLLDS